MSAFIVDDNVINAIVNVLQAGTQNDRVYPNPQYVDRTLMITSTKEARTMGYNLRAMNEAAIQARYDYHAIEKFTGNQEYKYLSGMPVTRVQVFKHFECLLYQCSEGNIPHYPLFKAIEKYKNTLACRIVGSSKEYDNAKW